MPNNQEPPWILWKTVDLDSSTPRHIFDIYDDFEKAIDACVDYYAKRYEMTKNDPAFTAVAREFETLNLILPNSEMYKIYQNQIVQGRKATVEIGQWCFEISRENPG